MSEQFDVTIIGSGPGGYVCAIRAAQLGLKVAIVEKRPTHGGTCLNVGCIPSKALLHATERFEEAEHDFAKLGIEVSKPKVNLDQMMAHKSSVIKSNVDGINYLFKKNKITAYQGIGELQGGGLVKVTAPDGTTQSIASKNIVIATGSDVTPLPGVDIDEVQILSSTGALNLPKVPEHMVVVGAGVIGLELGSVWRRLGAKVTVVEYLDRILPGMDSKVTKQFQRMLAKQGMDFKLSTKVASIDKTSNGVTVHIEPSAGGDAVALEADCALIAIGRRPFTQGLGLDKAGVALGERGMIGVNHQLKTNVDGIYAIGDVIEGPMLAHKAEEEGVFVAETLAGLHGHVNYDVIPGVVYTYPEIASVGKTQEDLKAEGIAFKVGEFPFIANGRAKANMQTDGFAMVLADETTDRVLGVHIVGPCAGELIGEACVLMEFGGSAEDLARTCHAHPTLSEALKEAALAVEGRAIHS